MTTILLAIVPLLVTFLTTLIKKIPIIDNTNDQATRNVIIRGIAAILSLGGVIGAFMLTGQTPDTSVVADDITVIAFTFLAFLGSVGTHEITSAKPIVSPNP